MNLKFDFDENLRETAFDVSQLHQEIDRLKKQLTGIQEHSKKVSTLGELAVYLRIANQLDSAEEHINRALEIILKQKLGLKFEIQQKIRLAHVYQWQKKFELSNSLFSEIINACRSNPDQTIYLDFALQHSGKNQFDQENFNEALNNFTEALSLRIARQAPQNQIESTELAIKRTNELLLIR